MVSVNSTNFSTEKPLPLSNNENNKNDIDVSIFLKKDTDGLVNEDDFVGYEDIGEKIKLMNYFGLKWDSVKNIISGLFNSNEKKFDGNLNVFSNELKFENQILVKNISTAQTLKEVQEDLSNKGIIFSYQKNEIKYQQDGFDIEIRMNSIKGHEHEVMTTIKKDNKVLQKIFSAPAIRGNSGVKEIENYNNDGKMITYAQYNDNGIYLMDVYSSGDKSRIRYAVSRDAKSVNIVKDGKVQKYSQKGKPIE